MFYSLPVLMYHSISRFKHRLCVAPERFEDHCRTLARAGWRGVSLREAEDFFLKKKRLPRKVCLITLDDGYLDNYVYAEPLLRRYGHKGVIFPVADMLGTEDILRSNSETLTENSTSPHKLPDLDKRKTVSNKAGFPVRPILFCTWREIVHMHKQGSLAAAPHSLRHDRVVENLNFKALYHPNKVRTFFDVPPHEAVWGFPCFPLTHALAGRGYILNPELFTLVKNMVPQETKAADLFLNDKKNIQAVMTAVSKLPSLGELESEEGYRERLVKEFISCRDVFSQKLGEPPLSFCWPWGDYNALALEEARKVGFKIFFTTMRGANVAGHTRTAHRIAVRDGSGEDILRLVRAASLTLAEISLPALGWLKKRFFKA
ncbi:MAG: polysaccharide deacetylase family protein [Deltaproteobacteria bacterium]|jgi:peptidoglycan/xylan/chitin deacetylase (PgdA/CDA1 family)|nr:polysaccharide deacetylase family protein [Deltaproteobacteria bacterium]